MAINLSLKLKIKVTYKIYQFYKWPNNTSLVLEIIVTHRLTRWVQVLFCLLEGRQLPGFE